ncbi:hypothetical protein DH2020_033484 [Rehmannia glutinosa]|uniref:Uncharacterized protein n=1 Tax=Rehmannia glutinosa TaxID=99300 RepID=A0ABR0VCD3_REHGL
MWRQTSEYVVEDLCHCGRNSVVKTSWTDLNPGRRYKACKKFWVSFRAQQIIPGLLKRINKHDNEVVKLKDEVQKLEYEVQKLEDVVEKLENELKKKRSRDRWMWIVLVLSWIVVYLMM